MVEFKNQKDTLGRDTGNWTDLVLTFNSPEVQIVMGEENIQRLNEFSAEKSELLLHTKVITCFKRNLASISKRRFV